MDDLLTGAGSELLRGGGIYGVIIIGLFYFIMQMRGELRDERAAHKVELASKDALILKLQEDRLNEARSIIELAKSTTIVLDGVKEAQEGVQSGLQALLTSAPQNGRGRTRRL